MTKYETTTEEIEILVLEARIDELSVIQAMLHRPKNYDEMNWHEQVTWVVMQAGKIGSRCDENIEELTTQLQALKQKARVS